MSNNNLHRRNLPVPFFSQREVTYRWRRRAGNIVNGGETVKGVFYTENAEIATEEPVSLAWTSCNIVSLCMLLHYYGITDDSPNQMLEKYFQVIGFIGPDGKVIQHNFSQEKNEPNRGPNRLIWWWTLKQFPHLAYNVPKNYIKQRDDYTLNQIQDNIAAGNPVMFSFGPQIIISKRTGTGWQRGHIAVIRGFTENNDVILNDPWGTTTDEEGHLNPDSNNYLGIYNYSIGRGDNTFIRRNELNRIINASGFSALSIEYPHIWSFPFKQNMNVHNNNNAGYPISTNRFWHDGIHITGEGAVYAIGPGRIVAARLRNENNMPTNGSNNFVLVRHKIRVGNQLKEFYSHYMHLAPVDIAQRIREQIADGHTEREKDWLDQIITYIRPKCAIVRIHTDSSNVNSGTISLDGLEGDKAPQIYYRNNEGEIVPTDPIERLANRALIYLCPVNQDTQTRLETINPNEELQDRIPASFYNDVANIEKYKELIGNERYYKFYHIKTGTGNNVSWVIRYVKVTCDIEVKDINKPEFIYYRRILAKLLKGEVTVFAKEETRRKTAAMDQSAIKLLEENLKLFFPEEDIFISPIATAQGSNNWDKTFNAMYGDIRNYYKKSINQIRTTENQVNMLDKIVQQLSERLFYFCKTLLAYPAELLSDPKDRFKLDGKWIKQLVLNSDSVYREILRLVYPNNNEIVDEHVANFKEILDYSTNMNDLTSNKIDYYFEVNKNTKLGMPGRFKNDNNIIHFEIFSDNATLIPAENAAKSWSSDWEPNNRKFVEVQKSTERNDFFNAGAIIERLRNANLLNGLEFYDYHGTPMIKSEEISDLIIDPRGTGINISLQYAMVQHLHSHTEFTADIWEEIIKNGVGINNTLLRPENLKNYLSYKWFNNEIINELNPPRNSIFRNKKGVFAVFYHPIRFLAWLDENLTIDNNLS